MSAARQHLLIRAFRQGQLCAVAAGADAAGVGRAFHAGLPARDAAAGRQRAGVG